MLSSLVARGPVGRRPHRAQPRGGGRLPREGRRAWQPRAPGRADPAAPAAIGASPEAPGRDSSGLVAVALTTAASTAEPQSGPTARARHARPDGGRAGRSGSPPRDGPTAGGRRASPQDFRQTPQTASTLFLSGTSLTASPSSGAVTSQGSPPPPGSTRPRYTRHSSLRAVRSLLPETSSARADRDCRLHKRSAQRPGHVLNCPVAPTTGSTPKAWAEGEGPLDGTSTSGFEPPAGADDGADPSNFVPQGDALRHVTAPGHGRSLP